MLELYFFVNTTVKEYQHRVNSQLMQDSSMEFEDILQEVGGFGLYQKILIALFLVPTYTLLPWTENGLIFMTGTPEHWCHVPEVANSNLSIDLQKQLIRPPQDPSCSMHDINYSEILQSGNLTANSSWSTKACDNGWEYDTTDYDSTAVSRWNMVCEDAHYTNLVLSMMYFGSVFELPLFGFLSDKVGRKPIMFSLVVVIAIAEISSVLSPYFIMFVAFRALHFGAGGTVYRSGFILLLELMNPNARSCTNILTTTFWSIGLCLLALIAWLNSRSWVRLSIVTSSCALGLTLLWNLIPESPVWLISEGRYDEALDILLKISKRNGKTAHKDEKQMMQKIQILGAKIKMQKADLEKHYPTDFFKYPMLRKRFLLITICWISLSSSYYGLQVNVRNLTGNEYLNFFLVCLVEIPGHIATWVLMERIGRRWCLVIGFAISGVACIIPVILPAGLLWIDVIAALLAKVGMSCAFMAMYQLCAEIFPTSLRCQGMALSVSIASAATGLVVYMLYLAKYGAYIPFLIFSIASFTGGICGSFLPESLNKNLPQTIEDAENFEKEFKFLSCPKSDEEEMNLEVMKTAKCGLPINLLSVTGLNSLSKDKAPKDSSEVSRC